MKQKKISEGFSIQDLKAKRKIEQTFSVKVNEVEQ